MTPILQKVLALYQVPTVEALLERLGVVVSKVTLGGEIHAYCPFHDDEHPSFDVQVATGYWICRSQCGGGGIVELIARLTGCTTGEVYGSLSRRLPVYNLDALRQHLRDRRGPGDRVYYLRVLKQVGKVTGSRLQELFEAFRTQYRTELHLLYQREIYPKLRCVGLSLLEGTVGVLSKYQVLEAFAEDTDQYLSWVRGQLVSVSQLMDWFRQWNLDYARFLVGMGENQQQINV